MKNNKTNQKLNVYLPIMVIAFTCMIMISCKKEHISEEVSVDENKVESKIFENRIETVPITSFLKEGESIALEILDVEAKEDNSFNALYKSELKMISKDAVAIVLKEDKNCDREVLSIIYNSDGTTQIDQSTEPEINDFVLRNYTEWCGKWRGRKRMWRICTGSDCGDGIAVCFQRKLPKLPL